ncbi:MAG: alpha/beta hydrolase family protein [Hyphomicrobiales bacterium]
MTALRPSPAVDNAADILRVDLAYERLNHLWAMHGPVTIGSIYQYPGPRANVIGLDDSEVDRIVRGIRTFFAWGANNDWIAEWTKAGEQYSARAEAAMAAGRKVTAGETWRLASSCYFFGWYIHNHFVPIPARDRAQALCIEAYRKAAPLLNPPSIRVDIPFRGRTLPGYLRVPDGRAKTSAKTRWPVVVVVGGANSTKEENHPLTTQMLQRGLATLAYDGPGQNEYLLNGGEPLTMVAYDASLNAVVDWLCADERIDSDRIGLFGRSGGGITGMHAAASEPRLKALVAHPATYDWGPRIRNGMDVLTLPLEVGHWLGARTLEEVKAFAERELTIRGVVGAIKARMLLVNGRYDSFFDIADLELLKAEATAPVETIIFDAPVHGGPPSLSWPLASDWLAEQLGGIP